MSAVRSQQIENLLKKYIDETIAPEELQQLRELIHDPASTELLHMHLQATFADMELSDKNEQHKELVFRNIREKLHFKSTGIIKTLPAEKRKPAIKYYWVAAALLVIISITYFILTLDSEKALHPKVKNIVQDIQAPDKNNASITLADGTVLYLDSAGNGSLAQQGNIQLVKLDNGQLVYKTTEGEILKDLQYNTLNNPRGSRVINMRLADGTQVWLNAGSSVTYPVVFAGDERRVSITGEAYFEVSHDNTKPFYVNKAKAEVEVLGTHFNVNAYDDEPELKITLLEGSVRVNAFQTIDDAEKSLEIRRGLHTQSVLITPGQQAQLSNQPNKSDEKIKVQAVDTEQVMAWKNGLFNFQNTDLKTVMRQIARWYNVDIVYEGKIPDLKFGGDIIRDQSLQQVLLILKDVEINCRIENKTIIITN